MVAICSQSESSKSHSLNQQNPFPLSPFPPPSGPSEIQPECGRFLWEPQAASSSLPPARRKRNRSFWRASDMVEGGVAIVKYLLFLANLVLWTGGLGLIILGSLLQLKFAGLLDILGDERLATPVLLLAFGLLCTLLGFLGCCGAIRENYCLTVSFAVLLALVIMVETAIVITAYALSEDLRGGLANQLQQGLHRYNRSSGVQTAWDQTQQSLSCCGVVNSSDWSTLGAVPDSCCVVRSDGCAAEMSPLHQAGCMEKVESWVLLNAALVSGASAVLAGLQVIGVCFACCLSKSILKDFHDFYY